VALKTFITAGKWLSAASFIPLGLFVYDRFGKEEHGFDLIFGAFFISADVTLLIWLLVWTAKQPKPKEATERIPGDW
jgi:hypothetical protein